MCDHQQRRTPPSSGLVPSISDEKRSGLVRGSTSQSEDFHQITVDAGGNFHKWIRENHSLLVSERDGVSEKVVRRGFLVASIHRATQIQADSVQYGPGLIPAR
ncbi:hypothetical protein [Burkholderia stabilis]|uniref:hypothetical protein n=1 Tax=Burkholderia stabilis TaxID=95485 RepID=UPI001F4BADE9|nr:hypothetical protein [Burkholderia stabilis]